MKEVRSANKLANIFAWVNWILSALCIVFFIAILFFAFIKVDAKWEGKIYALLIMFIVFLFPTIFFFLNGLILKSKDGSRYDQEKISDF